MAQLNRTISYKGIQLSIDYTYYPASKGARDSFGLPIEPDEQASIDIETLEMVYVDSVSRNLYIDVDELLEDQIDEIEAKLLEELSDDGPEDDRY